MSEDEPVETFKMEDNRELRIYNDLTPVSPRVDMDNIGKIVSVSRRYNLSDDDAVDPDGFNSLDEISSFLESEGYDVILPVYIFDHGGITISTTPFSCGWDSGQLGFIYANVEDCQEINDEDYFTEDDVIKILEGEIETYDTYLRGEIYGFRVVKLTRCKCCDHVSEEEEEAVWGYYGSDCAKNGIFDTVGYKPEEKEE